MIQEVVEEYKSEAPHFSIFYGLLILSPPFWHKYLT
jgi:hypothetical protein